MIWFLNLLVLLNSMAGIQFFWNDHIPIRNAINSKSGTSLILWNFFNLILKIFFHL